MQTLLSLKLFGIIGLDWDCWKKHSWGSLLE